MPSARLRRIAKRLALAIAILVVVVAAAAGWIYYRYTRGGLPVTAGREQVAGLGQQVEVRRDRSGVPHITAATERDLYFAQGYVTAQDRLWQMDLLRRDASGRLAELVGAAAVDRDVKHRTLGLRLAADRALATVDPRIRGALDAYAAGVNAYIASHGSALPVEFGLLRYEPEPWSPTDSLVIGKLMAETLGTSYERDLMRAEFASVDRAIYDDLFAERTSYDTVVVGTDASAAASTARVAPVSDRAPSAEPSHTTDDELMVGSNNWVVAGSRTATGKPLLANDPHLALGLPPIWYATHLTSRDGALDVVGVTFPGAPGITIGHNGRVAWGVTNFGPDVQDLYVEEFDESGRRYRSGDAWLDAEVRQETIAVAGDAPRVVDVLTTRHGPVVRDIGATKYALRWTALDATSELPAFYFLNRAASWEDFRAALATYPGPMQNFVYADVDGHIGYWGAGNVPIRRTGTGDVPYPGASDAGDWLGYVPFDRLPHVFDPPDGFVVTANNRVVGDSVTEFYTHEWFSPFRARRIDDLVRPASGMTSETMSSIQNDVYSYPDAIFAREALAMARAKVAEGGADLADWQSLVADLDGWDGRLTVESVPAAVVVTTRKEFFDSLLKAKLGDRAATYQWFGRETLYAGIVEQRPARWLPEGATWESVLIDAHRAARRSLAERFGTDASEWRYGKLNTFTLAHPLGRQPGLATALNVAPFEVSGGSHTVKAVGVSRGWGPSMRLVVDLSNFDRTTLVLPAGQSGQPASAHYADQTEDWRVGRTHEIAFSESAVAAASVETLTLVP